MLQCRLKSLMADVSSSITIDDVMKKLNIPSTHASARRINKNITLGKVEGSVEVLHSLQKLTVAEFDKSEILINDLVCRLLQQVYRCLRLELVLMRLKRSVNPEYFNK